MNSPATLLSAARDLAYSEQKQTGMPIREHIDLCVDVGRRLSKQLHADKTIVEIGVLMMDCMIGEAIAQGKKEAHVEMSRKRTEKLLAGFDVPEETRINILHCVSEHHGAEKFYSLESEVCCNVDSYQFVSKKGFLVAVRYMPNVTFEQLVSLLREKVEEKWKKLSLDYCHEELKEEYEAIHAIVNR